MINSSSQHLTLKKIKKCARKAVSHYVTQLLNWQGMPLNQLRYTKDLERQLQADKINGPKHFFGYHECCKSYLCNGTAGAGVYAAVL